MAATSVPRTSNKDKATRWETETRAPGSGDSKCHPVCVGSPEMGVPERYALPHLQPSYDPWRKSSAPVRDRLLIPSPATLQPCAPSFFATCSLRFSLSHPTLESPFRSGPVTTDCFFSSSLFLPWTFARSSHVRRRLCNDPSLSTALARQPWPVGCRDQLHIHFVDGTGGYDPVQIEIQIDSKSQFE